MSKKNPFLDLAKINSRFSTSFRDAFSEVLDSGWYLRGMATAQFEEAFSAYCGIRHCVGVANGLDALTLSLLAKKEMDCWPENAEVIVPAHTFVATAQAVVRAGLRPVAVEVLDDGLISPEAVESAVNQRTRAIIPVHLYGKLADMDEICSIAKQFSLFVPVRGEMPQLSASIRERTLERSETGERWSLTIAIWQKGCGVWGITGHARNTTTSGSG